jgi:hypothetical protein
LLWQKYPRYCGVRGFWNGEDDQFGRLPHKAGDAERARWVFDYDASSIDDDESDTGSACTRRFIVALGHCANRSAPLRRLE